MEKEQLRESITTALRKEFDVTDFERQIEIVQTLVELDYLEEGEEYCEDLIAEGFINEKQALKLLKIKV